MPGATPERPSSSGIIKTPGGRLRALVDRAIKRRIQGEHSKSLQAPSGGITPDETQQVHTHHQNRSREHQVLVSGVSEHVGRRDAVPLAVDAAQVCKGVLLRYAGARGRSGS
jgi:hypothetical protein